jgi:creatinine amidohydrolase
MEDYNPEGAAGNAAAATAEKGRSLIEASAAQLAALLAEVSRLPLSTAHTQPLP